MQEQEQAFTIEELAEQTGLPVRTIRFYIAEGLLSGPGARGKAASYSDEHLLRLRLIRRLSEQRVPLAEMRGLLARLSREEARAVLAEEEQFARERARAAQAPSPKEYLETLLAGARAARQKAPEPPRPMPAPAATPPAPAAPPISPAGEFPAVPASRYPPRPVASPAAQPQEAWQRWELAPGVELHVRADARDRYRHLIERLFWEAGEAMNHLKR